MTVWTLHLIGLQQGLSTAFDSSLEPVGGTMVSLAKMCRGLSIAVIISGLTGLPCICVGRIGCLFHTLHANAASPCRYLKDDFVCKTLLG